MGTLRRVAIAGVIAMLFSHGARAAEAVKLVDRSMFVDQQDTTLDDPRQITKPRRNEASERILVLRDGLLFDGTGRDPRRATVVIRGNRIAEVLPSDAASWPEGAEILDVGGGWVMPGLIDLHTHLTYAEPGEPDNLADDPSDATLRGVERLRYYLESGITSVRDVASHGVVPFRLKRWVGDGRIAGPRVFAAGQLITGTGGHGADFEGIATAPAHPDAAVREASGPDDWRNAVREQFKRGADLIKIGSHYSPEEVQAAVDEAHRLGLRVTVDAETHYIDMAVEAGVDCIEHLLPRSQRAIEQMARQGICSVPTRVPYQIIEAAGGYYGVPSRRFSIKDELHGKMLRTLRSAGVKVGVGTDLVADWYRHLPTAYVQELKNLVAAGSSLPEALVAATKTSAEILGLGDRLGTLEPGKIADILVVDGRPDHNLDDLARVRHVLRDGRLAIIDGQLVTPRHQPMPMPAASR